jgi:hypothetical protein
MSVISRKISHAVCVALACTLANAARAHDTWLIPDPKTATAVSSTHREVALLLTTGAEFPALGTTTSPERLLRANLISDKASVPLLVGKSTETTLGLRGLTVANSVVMAVVQLKPRTIELTPDVVPLYLKELGGSLSMSRRYQASGQWRESYSKNAKMWIRVGPDAAPASMFKPMNLPYELVPSRDPTRLKAGNKLEICAYASGKSAAKAYLGMVAADGTKTMRWSNAKGCADFTMRSTSGFLMHGIFITESTLPELDWESHFASFTVLDATPKAAAIASNSTL